MKIYSAKALLKRITTTILTMAGVSLCARGAVTQSVTAEEAAAYGGISGGDIINMIVEDDGSVHFAHIFTNTSSSITFTVPGDNFIVPGSARILAVGGGGAGGGDCGGGGGAGGVVISNDTTLAEGDYTISVGKGAPRTGHALRGDNGADSTISFGGNLLYRALGGGGGSNCNEGSGNYRTAMAGGSGGGASQNGAVGAALQPSDSISPGYGSAGGAGNGYRGGGGGGASAAGTAGTANNSGKGGDGGNGIACDITGESVYYGGGGGGGSQNTAGGGGGVAGQGGGGRGGNYNGTKKTNWPNSAGQGCGEDGEAATGGGGGGGGGDNGATQGGAGGSGIVVIRYAVPGGALTKMNDGSVLFKFDSDSSFTLPAPAQVRVLAVGGGGAGGTGTSNALQGGNAGGGAGRFIDATNVWQGATYTIDVGAGGSAVESVAAVFGNDGEPTIISTGGNNIVYMPGGGGGAYFNKAGREGGSGGGGSKTGAAGSAIATYGGLGYAGGAGSGNNAGAGGGGAGGAGKSPANGAPGAGGSGVASDITGSVLYYAGGGGGGYRANTVDGGLGGSGVGGNGGGSSAAKAGLDGTGSGGGGGSSTSVGGAGGSGIAYIRVIRYMPTAPEASYTIEFDGNEHLYYTLVAPEAGSTGWVTSETGDACPYTIKLSGSDVSAIVATEVGTYNYTVALKSEYLAQGWTWSDGTAAAKSVVLKISRKALSDVALSIDGWQIGETPSIPVLTANMSLANESSEGAHDGDYYLLYSSDGNVWKTFSAWYGSAEVGTHYVRAVIRTDSPNFEWTGTNPEAEFKLWTYDGTKYPTYLGYHKDISVDATKFAGVTETLTDFPMLVRVSDDIIPGFYKYANSSDGYEGIRFTVPGPDGSAVTVPFEVNTWNENGESSFWVKVPSFAPGAYAVTINYGDIGEELPENDPSKVWTDYIAVWHLDAGRHTEDATGHGYTLSGGTMVAGADSVFGSSTYASDGTLVAKEWEGDYPSSGSNFTYTAWYKAQGYSSGTLDFVGKKPLEGTPDPGGWKLRLQNAASVQFFTSSTNSNVFWTRDIPALNANWDFFAIASTGSSFSFFVNDTKHLNNITTPAYQIFSNGYELNVAAKFMAADEVRVTEKVRSQAWLLAEYLQGKLSSDEPGIVVGDETFVTPGATFSNRWLDYPTVNPTSWYVGQTTTINLGSALYGVVEYAFNGTDGSSLTNAIPTTAGSYDVVFFVRAGASGTISYTGLTYAYPQVIDILVRNDGTGGLGGTTGSATLSGRVLLANDDDLPGFEIAGQCYWQTNETADTYWVHENESAVDLMNIMGKGTINTLMSKEPVEELCGATRIWHLDNVRIGNTYPRTLNESDVKCFLPWSDTAKVLAEDGNSYVNTKSATNSVNLAMRSVAGAAVYSPCYTNGIGTIYFDAVNAWTVDNNYPTNYTIVVEFATNCVESVGFDKLPTDANLTTLIEVRDEEENLIDSYNDVDYNLANWQSIDMVPLYYDGTEFQTSYTKTFGDVVNSFDGPVGSLCLDETTGGRRDKFFRIRVPVLDELNGYRGPIRFRIKRTTTKGVGLDSNNFILLDNLIVSYPAMTANLEPKGKFDPMRYGKKALGTECAFDVPFPAIGDSFRGLVKASFETNPLVVDADTSTFVTGAKMHYRWRYLSQEFGDWAAVAVSPTTWETPAALNLSGYADRPGDVEYWFEIQQNAPYYSYTDYSGLGIDLGGLYSENIPVVTNRCDMGTLESCGTDWFVRLREGKSPYESLQVAIDDGSTTNIVYMEVVKDHTWRGYYQTFTNEAGRVKMQVRGVNCQEFGSGEFVESVTNMYCVSALTNMPISTTMELGTEDDWNDLDIDAMTGYLMFQIDDTTRSLTIVHADYQSFNEWNDAKGNKFVGNSSDNLTKSGTSAGKKKYTADWTAWTSMAAGSDDWTVPYIGWADVTHMLGREPNVEFQSDTSGNWQVGPGIWVSKWYDDARNGMGVALQMAGQGRGYVQMTDSNILPRGFGTLSFNARLAQTIDFDDFVYYEGVPAKSLTNYTFTTRGAFDIGSNKKFRGKATLSLVAHYRPKIGCYEFRIEQINANKTTNPDGIGKRSQRFSLYRWRVGDDGTIEPTLLGSYMNDAFDIPETSGAGGNYMPLYISVSNDVSGAVCIMAGVGRSSIAASESAGGESGKSFYSLCYKDTSPDKIMTGTYGCLSANCPARQIRPCYWDKPVGFLNAGPAANKIDRFSNNAITFTGTKSDFYAELKITDLEDLTWATTPGRFVNFADSQNSFGFTAPTNVVTQKLVVYTVPVAEVSSATASKDWKWTAVTNVVVSGFGSNGKLTAYNVPLYVAEDSYIKIAVDGKPTDTRRDVVIDSLTVTGWRGASWNEDIDDLITYAPNNFEPSELRCNFNEFSFFDAWVTNITVSGNTKTNALLLSARRTPVGGVCGIKSPLMNGESLGSDKGNRGIGLGMLSFSYRNAQPNVKLLVQIATNGVGSANMATINNLSEDNWTTVSTIDFGTGSGRPSTGVASVYIGLHGVEGAMRVIMDPAVVSAVSKQFNPNLFGDIFITGIKCTDEPNLDDASWWGWNLRAVGISSVSGSDEENRMYLPDMTQSADDLGLSMALNDSITKDTVEEDEEAYKVNRPFVQTPIFGTNLVGEIMFRARKWGYAGDATADAQDAYVTLLGAKEDNTSHFYEITNFCVNAKTFKTYSYKTEPGADYAAFRLAVSGVDGVDRAGEWPGSGSPVRVILDEVLVTEAVRAKMGFKNVGAFRGYPGSRNFIMNDLLVVPEVPSEQEQPLCNESWGIQCEIYKELLPDEIDLEKTPNVRLHYFEGKLPWGWNKWKSNANAKTVKLTLATDSPTDDNLVYRSSNKSLPANVIAPVSTPGITYQYMLEVEFWQVGSTVPSTNWLSSAQWTKPEWYNQIDFNEEGGAFSAYTILDTVAPHWAWFNEVNLFDEYDLDLQNSEVSNQYIEVAVPAEADISGWKIRMLEPIGGQGEVVTNTLAVFGENGLAGTKKNLLGMDANKVYRVIATPKASSQYLKKSDGTLDGTWQVQIPTSTISAAGEILGIQPFGLQLVRASDIVEHEIVCIGTNWWGNSVNYGGSYHPTNTVNTLNKSVSGARFFYAGADEGAVGKSIDVFDGRGETAAVWTNSWVKTPGQINRDEDGRKQNIDPNHPTPNGDTIIVYCNLDTTLGERLTQTVGDLVDSPVNGIQYLVKGSDLGLTIRYKAAPWFKLESVTTNMVGSAVTTEIPFTVVSEADRLYETVVGIGASNNFTVVAKPNVQDKLRELGLGDDNRYTDAVVDWLSGGSTLRGEFANDDGEIRLAEYRSLGGNFITNLTLTAMYWLDMDPTAGGLALYGGMSSAPTPRTYEYFDGYMIGDDDVEVAHYSSFTNLRMNVKMWITNENDNTAWAPYTLRGVRPGETTAGSKFSLKQWAADTNVTFKITGLLGNGLVSSSDRKAWVPLRWFVFRCDDDFVSTSFDENFETKIEIDDPYTPASPGYSAWRHWFELHGGKFGQGCNLFYFWSLDDITKPIGFEMLEKENYYEYE